MVWCEVSRAQPCLICGKPNWCSASDDGTWAVCRRVDTGEGRHRVDKAGTDFWLYRLAEGPRTPPPELPERQEPKRADPDTLGRVYRYLLAELNLNPAHRQNLLQRGLSDIERHGYRSLPVRGRAELAKRLVDVFGAETLAQVPGFYTRKDGDRRWWSLAGPAGLLIPCRDTEGRIVALKVRADEPGDHGKYLYVSSKAHGGPGPGAPVHVPLWDGRVGETVRVTEGELKADVATVLSGTLTISVPGVSCWRAAIPTLKALGAKRVLLAFDTDWEVNQHVKRALHRAAEALVKEGFEVLAEIWPTEKGKGIDDLLAAGGKPKVLRVTVKAKAEPKGKSRNEPVNGPADDDADWQPRATWPDPPRPEAFYGLAGDFVRLIESQTEADPVAILTDFLCYFGIAAGRGPYFRVGATIHYPVEFVITVGKTAKARKNTAHDWVRQVFRLADPELRERSGLSSGEGLIFEVRDPIWGKFTDKKTGEVVETTVDEGVEDKRLVVYESEFALVLKMLERQGNSLSAILREIWDCREELTPMTKTSRITATNPHIGIIAHITKHELTRYITETELMNGLMNRFLLFCVKRSKLLPEGGSYPKREIEEFAKRLQKTLLAARSISEMSRDDETQELWRQKYAEISCDAPGLLGAAIARAEAHVLRLSMIYALLDASPVIKKRHLEAALAVWDYAERSARFVFGGSLGDAVADEILRALRQAGERGLSRTEVRNLFGRHRKKEDIDRALATLAENGLATYVKEKTPGRSAIRWFFTDVYCDKSDKSDKADLTRVSGDDALRPKCDKSLSVGGEQAFVALSSHNKKPANPENTSNVAYVAYVATEENVGEEVGEI